jgi:hypothetical protein
MIIPSTLDLASVKKAALALLETKDDEGILHQEFLVVAIPLAEAEEWQERLRAMKDGPRLADRNLLLAVGEDGHVG